MNVLPLHFIFGIFILGMVLVFGALICLEKWGWMFSKNPDRAGELFEDKQTLTASFEGKEYQYIYDSGYGESLFNHTKRHYPPCFLIKVNCVSTGSFRIVKENRVDVLFKMIGMFREVQTGDGDFDKKYCIETDFPHFASCFFKEARNRKIIEEIFQMGFTEIEHDGFEIRAKWKHFVITGDFDPSFVEKSARALVSLTGAIPETVDVTVEPKTPYLIRMQRKVAFALSSPLAIIDGYLFFYGERVYPPLEEGLSEGSLYYSLPLFTLFMGYVLFLLKGSTSSYRTTLTLLGISLIGFVSSGMGLAPIINGAADSGRTALHTVKVIRKSDGRNGSYVHVDSWRSDMKQITIPVSYETRRQVQPYQTRLNVYTKPGRLGFEWLVGLEVYQPKDKWDV